MARRRKPLEGKIALVTGASSGIGRAIAIGFARAGSDLIVVARRARHLVEVVQRAESEGRRALLVVGDVSQERTARRVIHQARLVFPRIDILVNNAGLLLPEQPLHDLLLSEWDRALAVNLRGPFLFSRFVVPDMVAAGYGRVINVTGHAAAARPRSGATTASKAGLLALTRVMGRELRGTGVLVNALDPGRIRSEMSPDAGRAPERVVPLALALASLPASGPCGREFALA